MFFSYLCYLCKSVDNDYYLPVFGGESKSILP